MEQLKNRILDLLYPPRCPICNDVLPAETFVCETCDAALPRMKGARCGICGSPLQDADAGELCQNCTNTRHHYLLGRGAFAYREPIRESLVALKYQGAAEHARGLARLSVRESKDFLQSLGRVTLVPVPLHKAREQKRGYNQAALLAREMAKELRLPLSADCLYRKEETRALKELNRVERFQTLQEAFYVPKDIRPPKRILLIDDIYTTGATMDASAAVLLAAGAREVFFFTVCQSSGQFL